MMTPDTGPQDDGTRRSDQWINAMGKDAALIRTYVERVLDDDETPDHASRVLSLALALKEARRLQSDIYRFGAESFGITREEIDAVET